MNIISKAVALIATGILAGCILHGPWDFQPKKKPVFQGIWVSAYSVADRHIQNACFERMYKLSEAFTEGVPFYDSAEITISGRFSSGGQTLLLRPNYLIPNCFSGDTAAKILRGETYSLTARFVWDSAGIQVTSVLQADAHVPTSFSIDDTVVAPSVALTGLAFEGSIFKLENFQKLPLGPRTEMLRRYGDTLVKLQTDTTALNAYLNKNGPKLFRELVELLQKDVIRYTEKDTLFYIGGASALNNLSHRFHSIRSDDVGGVLITQSWDTVKAFRPTTSFDSIGIRLGIKPDSSEFYYPGNRHRLLMLPNTINQRGTSVLDSIGVVNAWFWTDNNQLTFYGTEKAYADFQFTNTGTPDGGGPGDQNPKIVSYTNVRGGKGFFAGMIADTFNLKIKVDSLTIAYPYKASRAFACKKQGWFESRDCSGWYREFCEENIWVRNDCQLDAVYSGLDSIDSVKIPLPIRDSAIIWATNDANLKLEASRRYCIDNNYPLAAPACTLVKKECETGTLGNGCHLILWKSCDLNYWKMPACVEGRKSICQSKGDIYTNLCRGL